MTNEMIEKQELRKDNILALAKIIKQGRAEQNDERSALAEYSSYELSSVGALNLLLGTYLYDVGYRMNDSADVTIIVENGQVTGVYSNNEHLAAEVIDLDVQDEELLEHLKTSVEKVENTQLPIW